MLSYFGFAIFRFGSHPLPAEPQLSELRSLTDTAFVQSRLDKLSGVRTYSSADGRFPLYLGENSDCWARREDKTPMDLVLSARAGILRRLRG